MGYLGLAALVDGDAERGEALYAQSLTVFETLGEAKGIAEALTGLATAAAMRGLQVVPRSWAERQSALANRSPDARFPSSADSPTPSWLGRRTGDRNWDDAWTSGRALRIEEAIAKALAFCPTQ